MALHSMSHSVIELDKVVVHVISLIRFLWLWLSSVCPLIRIRGLWKLPDRKDWLPGKLGLVLVSGAILSKSLIQFSVDGWSCVPFLLFTWGQTMVCFPCDSAGKVSACNAGDLGWILRLGRYPGERKGYPLQYSGLENSMVCIVHGFAKSQA